MEKNFWRLMLQTANVPWWHFWDPRSGIRGGAVFGVIAGLAVCLLLMPK